MPNRLRLAALVPVLLMAAPAFAQEAHDAPLATGRGGAEAEIASLSAPPPAAPAQPAATATASMSTDDQIAAYLNEVAAAPPPTSVADAYGGYIPYDDRRPHGEVGVSIGTGGYRSIYARQTMPVGKTGTLDVAFAHSRFRGWGGGAVGATGLGVSLDFSQRASRCEAPPPWRRDRLLASDCLRPDELADR